MKLKTTQRAIDEFAALYRLRGDGDWDFVAGVSIDVRTFPEAEGHTPLDFLGLIADQIQEHTLLVFHTEPDWPAVFVQDPEGLEQWTPNLN